MKKIFSAFLLFLLLFSSIFSVYASFENPPIVDEAGYLMQSELAELSKEFDRVREKYDFDVAIYTESDMSGDTAEESADDIYDYLGYGAGDGYDGILLYICYDTREYHFTVYGEGRDVFNENGLIYMEEQVLPYLQDDDYYEAFEVYIETAEELLEMASEGTPYNEKHYSLTYIIMVISACVLIPLLIAYLMMRSKVKKMKTAVSNDYAANYVKPGSMDVNVSRDIFLYSRIIKTERPKSNSGTHRSSSARVHGGRGGSF